MPWRRRMLRAANENDDVESDTTAPAEGKIK